MLEALKVLTELKVKLEILIVKVQLKVELE